MLLDSIEVRYHDREGGLTELAHNAHNHLYQKHRNQYDELPNDLDLVLLALSSEVQTVRETSKRQTQF